MTDMAQDIVQRRPDVCIRCGASRPALEYYSDVVDFKGLTLEVDGLVRTRCAECGYEWLTEGQELDNRKVLREAFSIERDRSREKYGLLTGEQIAKVLAELDLSKSEASALFGGGPNSFAKYIRGEVLQSVAMDRLLRLTLGFGKYALNFLRLGKDAPLFAYSAAFVPVASSTADVVYLDTANVAKALAFELSTPPCRSRLSTSAGKHHDSASVHCRRHSESPRRKDAHGWRVHRPSRSC